MPVFFCFDCNFRDSTRKLIRYLEAGKSGVQIDPIVIPGGAKNLSSPWSLSTREELLSYVLVSIEHHEADTVGCTTHAQCLAYGERALCGGDRVAQFEFQMSEHAVMDSVIKKAWSWIHVEHYYLNFDGIWKLNLETRERHSVLA